MVWRWALLFLAACGAKPATPRAPAPTPPRAAEPTPVASVTPPSPPAAPVFFTDGTATSGPRPMASDSSNRPVSYASCKEAVEAKAEDLDLVLSVNAVLHRASHKLSHAERVIVAVSDADLEVHNGGFDQYFGSSAGNDAATLRAGIREIGDVRGSAIVDKACAPFPGASPSADRGRRYEQLEAVQKKLGAEWDKELNAQFFEEAVEKTRTRLLAAYARAHCAEIDAP